jgi:Zn-dependent protease
MYARRNFTISRELEDLIIADLALTVAFTFALSGGLNGLRSGPLLLYLLPISFVAVSFSFVLHELMHKFVAQRFGAIAAFTRSDNGILMTLVSSMLGFLIGLPGATVIYSSRFTREEEAYVSLAGPLTNFVVFAIFIIAGSYLFPSFVPNIQSIFSSQALFSMPYLENVMSFTVFISIYLAFFNMLPIYPLDGSKVLRWNAYAYFVVIGLIFALLAMIVPIGSLVSGMVFVLIVALLLSSIYRRVLF